MKRMFSLLILVFLIVLVPNTLFAERPPMEITPLVGYNIGGATDFYQGRMDIKDSVTYGIMYSIILPPKGVSIDLSFTRADSSLSFTADPTYSPLFSDANIKMASNYIMIGSNKDFLQDKVRLFIGGDIGAAWFDSKDSSVSDLWLFAVDLKGGMKIYLSDRIGIRLQGRFLMPMDLSNSGLFVGLGGAGVTFGGTVFVFQGDFTAGLIIRL